MRYKAEEFRQVVLMPTTTKKNAAETVTPFRFCI